MAKLKIIPRDIRSLQKPKPISEKDRRLMRLAAKRDHKNAVNIHDSGRPSLGVDDVLKKSLREVD